MVLKVSNFFLVIPFLIFACDGITGMEGRVIDSETEKGVSEVELNFKSSFDEFTVKSDSLGYFDVFSHYSCGIKKCDESYTLLISKQGYKKQCLSEPFYTEDRLIAIEQK